MFIFYSCSNSKNDGVGLIELEPTQIVEQPKNSNMYLLGVNTIINHYGKIILCQRESKTLTILNEEYHLLHSFGREGYGPGEFVNPISCAVDDSLNFYVFNDGNKSFQIYNRTGQFSSSFSELDGGLVFDRFAIHENRLFYSSGINPLLISDLNNTSSASVYGEKYDYEYLNSSEENIRNQRHVFITDENNILTIGASEPIIEIFSMDGLLLNRYDFSFIPAVKSRLDYRDQKYQKNPEIRNNTVFDLIEDAYYFDNRLYALHYENDINGKVSCNKVISFKITENKIEIENHFLLKNEHENYLEAIGIIKNGTALLGFDVHSQSLIEYSL